MPQHKVTFEFEPTTGAAGTAGARAGWTETWYHVPVTDTDTCQEAAAQLATYRRVLLTPGWSLTAARISQLDAFANLLRRGRLIFYPPANAPGGYPGANQDEQPYDAVEIAVNSEFGSHRAFSMRGIGNNVVSAGARFLNPPAFAFGFNPWMTELTTTLGKGPWGLRTRTRTGRGLINGAWIEGALRGGFQPSNIAPVCELTLPADVAVGNTIVIGRVDGMRRLEGNWKIASVFTGVTSKFVQLQPKRRLSVQGVFANQATWAAYSYSIDRAAALSPGYGVSRRTGRPLQLVRGRRSNRSL